MCQEAEGSGWFAWFKLLFNFLVLHHPPKHQFPRCLLSPAKNHRSGVVLTVIELIGLGGGRENNMGTKANTAAALSHLRVFFLSNGFTGEWRSGGLIEHQGHQKKIFCIFTKSMQKWEREIIVFGIFSQDFFL